MFRYCLILTILFWPLTYGKALSQDDDSTNNTTASESQTSAEQDYQKFIKEHVGYKLLTVEHDKFKGLTKISTDPRMTNELGFKTPTGSGTHLELEAFGYVPDTPTKDNPSNGVVLIVSRTDDWQYLKCNEFNWLVDGIPLTWLDEKYDGDAVDGGVLEDVSIILTPKNFDKLSKAKSIDSKLCNDEFVFTQKQYWLLRWVNEQLKELLKPQPPKS